MLTSKGSQGLVRAIVFILVYPLLAGVRIPRYEDYPVTENWDGPPARFQITSPAERAYRTRLTDASKQPPNFAGHYRFTSWGCGANCITGGVINLASGRVVRLPSDGSGAPFSLCQSAYEGSGAEFKLNSRLLILKCGLNVIEQLNKNVPDVVYLVLEHDYFRTVLRIRSASANK